MNTHNTIPKNRWPRWILGGAIVAAVGWYYFSYYSKTSELGANTVPSLSATLRTAERATAIGKELIQKNFMLTRFVQNEEKRNLASESDGVAAVETRVNEGQYGRDAWGQPLHFKQSGNKVFVWSFGENSKLDSSPDQLLQEKSSGDDIVVSVSL